MSMAINSKRKGAEGERELARKLTEYGYKSRRGQQYCGSNGDADVVGLPGIYIECKRVEKLNIYNAVDQAKRDCSCEVPFGYDLPAVFHRKNNSEWLVTMPLEFWIELYREWQNGR
jgi:Holliday junction resolvase